MKTKTAMFRLTINLFALACLFNAVALVHAQSTWTNIVAASWGNAANWSPSGIPNAVDAVVNSGSVTINTTNTTENGAGTFPYIFGTLNGPASGSVGAIGGNNTANQIKAQVSSGTPTFNIPQGNLNLLSVLYGNQGYIKTNIGNLQFRFNSAAQAITGNVYIVQGSVEMNQDSSLGYATNAVILYDQASLTAGLSGAPQTCFVNPSRSIILNAPGGAGRLNWHGSGFTNVIQCVVSESAANSGVNIQRAVTSYSGTTGVTMFCNTNTYTGPTIVTEGVLILSNQNAIANSTLTPSGGTVAFHSGITANAFSVGGLAGTGALALKNLASAAITLSVGGNNASTIYSGQLTEVSPGGPGLVKLGTGTLDLQGTTDNSFVGINASNGIVILDKTSAAGVHAVGTGVIINGGTVQLSGSGGDQIFNANTVTINNGTFDLNGQTETIGGLAGGGGTNADSTLGTSATLTIGVATGTSVTNASAINGGNLVLSGPGTQVFSGADNRDANIPGLTTTVTGGTLQLGTGGALISFGGAQGITLTSPGTLALNGTGVFTNNLTGTGNLTVNGAGTVTVSGTDAHTGNTLVNTGTLALPAGGTSSGGSIITVASNATFNVAPGTFTLASGQTLNGAGTVAGNFTVAGGATNSGNLIFNGNVTLQAGSVLNPGSPLSAGTITNNGNITSGGYTLLYYLVNANTPGGGTNSLLNVTGNLNIGSAGGGNAAKLIVNGSPLNGTYVIANYGTFTGTLADMVVTGPSGRQSYTVQTNGTQLLLVVGGQAPQGLAWKGDGTANIWDANDSANKDWTNSALSAVDYFAQGDFATFDNSSTNLVVNLSGDLLPQSGSVVTVNSTNNYTFTGSGYIDGSASLTKTNSGTLTLQTPNSFTGPVNLNGGVVSVASVALNGAASPLGAGTTLAFNGGTLQYTGPNADGTAFNRAVTIGTNGATIDQSGTGYLYLTGLISGSGTLTKYGTNQLVVSGNNIGYTNVTYVQNGQVQIRNLNALGNSSSPVIATNVGASVATGGSLAGTMVKPLTLAGVGDSNGVLQANSTGVVNFSGAVNLVTNASIGGTGASNVISGVISGPAILTKVGAGTIVLSANNTYTGGTVINGGTLQLGIGAGGGTTGWLPPMPATWVLTNNAALAINHTNATALTNTISGTGYISDIGTGTVTLGASNNLTGGLVLGHPSINYSDTVAVNVANGAVLVTNSYALGTLGAECGFNGIGKLQLAGNINIQAQITAWSEALGVINIENVSGSNTLATVNGIFGNNYWPITSDAGLLTIATFTNQIYNSTFGRTLQLQGAGNGDITNIVDPSLNWLQLEKDGQGTWTLSGSCDIPLGVVVNAGTLLVDTNAQINALQRYLVISHAVAGGNLVVNGYLPVAGAVNVNSGLLGGSGEVGGNVNVQAAGAVGPSAGLSTNTSALRIDGGLNLGGNVRIMINKALVLTNDYITVSGTATNSGTGAVTLTNNGPVLVAGDAFTLFSQAVSNGAALYLSSVVRGGAGQFVTWSNHLALDGGITVLTAAPLGTNAYLNSLAFNPTDNLSPAFTTNGFVYAATNAYGIYPTVTVTNSSLTASNTLIVNGNIFQVLTSGVPSLALTNLGVGSTNVVKVLVTAQDTVTTNLYTVNVNQLAQPASSTNAYLTSLVVSPGAFTPVFATNGYTYAMTNYLPFSAVTVTVTNADLTATNALYYGGVLQGPLVSGTASGSLGLSQGVTNVIGVQVVSQSGTVTNLYTVNVTLQPSQTKPVLTNSVAGNTLTLSWPADHLGYRLLMQTNNLGNGVSGNSNDWATVAGSTALTVTNITILHTNLNEYYRLIYP